MFLCEEVTDTGLHRFMLRSPQRQAAWLAATVDPRRRATPHSDPLQTAADAAGLEPHPERLAEQCETASLVWYTGATATGGTVQRAFTAYSDPEGVYVLTGWTTKNKGQVAFQRIGRSDLIAFCGTFLSSTPQGIPMA